MYRIKSSGAVKSQGEIRKLHPNVSLPRVWTAEVCEFLGIDPVLAAPAPEVTDLQIAVQSGVKQDAKGNWVTDWDVRNKFSDYEKENEDGTKTTVTRAEQEAAYLAKKVAEKEASVRAERDKKLAETDWMVIKAAETGVALATDWATYRQALRDITAQEGFPDNVTWPTVE
jgi:hypothetical protein